MTSRELDHLIQSKVYEQAQKYRPTNLAVALPWIAVGILLIALVASHLWHANRDRKLESALAAQAELVIQMSQNVRDIDETVDTHRELISRLVRIATEK